MESNTITPSITPRNNTPSIRLKPMYITFGMLFLTLGAIGTVVPLIPTTPLILLAAVCFGKSSKKLSVWFLSTRLYRRTIEGFVKNRSMTIKAKAALLISITAFMGISFITMTVLHTPVFLRVILALIWLFHLIYFGFVIKSNVTVHR